MKVTPIWYARVNSYFVELSDRAQSEDSSVVKGYLFTTKGQLSDCNQVQLRASYLADKTAFTPDELIESLPAPAQWGVDEWEKARGMYAMLSNQCLGEAAGPAAQKIDGLIKEAEHSLSERQVLLFCAETVRDVLTVLATGYTSTPASLKTHWVWVNLTDPDIGLQFSEAEAVEGFFKHKLLSSFLWDLWLEYRQTTKSIEECVEKERAKFLDAIRPRKRWGSNTWSAYAPESIYFVFSLGSGCAEEFRYFSTQEEAENYLLDWIPDYLSCFRRLVQENGNQDWEASCYVGLKFARKTYRISLEQWEELQQQRLKERSLRREDASYIITEEQARLSLTQAGIDRIGRIWVIGPYVLPQNKSWVGCLVEVLPYFDGENPVFYVVGPTPTEYTGTYAEGGFTKYNGEPYFGQYLRLREAQDRFPDLGI